MESRILVIAREPGGPVTSAIRGLLIDSSEQFRSPLMFSIELIANDDWNDVLHRCVDAIRKRPARRRAASDALAIVRAMFGDDERLRLGQIEHLTGAMADARLRIKVRTASRAGRRKMIDHIIRNRDLP